jgi:hypothetical protein
MSEAGIAGIGIGQVKAPEATPPLVDLTGAEEQARLTTLLEYDEMHRISGTRWRRLQSTDDAIAAEEFRDLIRIGQELEERNERLTELHRWGAFSGTLTYQYQEEDSILTIDYALPTGNKPTVSVAWDDTANSDPVTNLQAFRNQVANTAGNPGVVFHISNSDLELALASDSLRGYFNIPVGQPFRPTEEDLAALVGAGTRFVIADQGFRPQSAGSDFSEAAHIKYKPEGKVLVTTEYNNNGSPIADTPNGDVEISTGYNSTAILKGPQSEIIMKGAGSYQRFLRQASRRIPRLAQPGAFLYATVRTP